MNDETRLALDDAETPVNPYSLLAAVNASARSANVAWLIFLGLMAYLLIAIASVTHRDLLLASDVTLPMLQVKIGLIRFFLLVPILFVLLHVGLLGKLALLAAQDAGVRRGRAPAGKHRPAQPPAPAGARQFLPRAGDRRAGPQPRGERVSQQPLLAHAGDLPAGPAALRAGRVPAVPRYRRHHGAPSGGPGRRCPAAAHGRVPGAAGNVTYFGAFWRTAVHNPGSLVFGVAVLVAALFVSAVCDRPRRSPPRRPPRLPHRA